MSSWAERVHRRAADFSNVVTSCGHPGSSAPTYPYRLEKVKFGVPLEEVCKNDNIPGPLLVLILKLNKESPNRRDVFRAPGHQGAMKKLIHFLQAGRLVNVDNYSVYTIASVLKKFLRKIPNGIFGRSGEEELFAIIELSNEAEQIERLHKLIQSLPKYTQHLLVLLFGTFRVIASNAAHAGTGMTSEALGVSVAPSFFQSCVSDGKTARMEDVLKFKVATKIMKHIIDKFATDDLFGRENYEYYARVTGRILKVQDEWICSFQYPPPPRGKQAQQKYALQHSLEAEKTWLQCQCERWGLLAQEESRSTPALLTSSSSALDNSVVSLGVTPEHSFMESCARLSVSLEGPGLFAMTSSPLPSRKHGLSNEEDDDDLDEDDYNNDDDDEDPEGADDEEDNDHNNQHQHFKQHLQQQQHFYTQQQSLAAEEEDDEDFAAELDISNGSSNVDGVGNNENIENQSYKANFRTCQNFNAHKLKSRSSSSTTNEQTLTAATTDPNFTDSPDDIDDEMSSVVKRRYKQNKKKISTTNATTQIRRFRSNTTTPTTNTTVTSATSSANNKSFDNAKNCDFLTNDYEYMAKAKAVTEQNQLPPKSRVCSRCKRGIRHSSSCSSSSGGNGAAGGGGGGANGSGMTMEELRAVNRYAESTKSLSYLPQVHERQTARMRTRSEWFLGPKDGDLLCVPPNTCSNCCLTAVNLQTVAGNYLGGGSTRDMRRMLDQHQLHLQQQQHINQHTTQNVTEAVNTSLYLYYKQQQQQQHNFQNLPLQRQSFHLSPEHMDCDETFATFANQQMNLHSMQQQLSAIQQQTQQQQQSQQQHQQQQHAALQFNSRQAQEGQGLFLDTNYGRYDFDDKDILVATTNKTTTDQLNLNNNNNNKENNYNNNNNNNNKTDGYSTSNRQHLIKTTTTPLTTNHDMTLLTPQTLQNFTQSSETITSLSFYQHQQLHATNTNNNINTRSLQHHHHHYHHNSQYYSTESLLNDDHDIDEDRDEKKNLKQNNSSTTKLSYQSSRLEQKQLQQQLAIVHQQPYHHHQHDHDSSFSNNTNNISSTKAYNTATTTTTNCSLISSPPLSKSIDQLDCLDLQQDMQEIDYIVPSHYRHSTPLIQRRRLRQQQQQQMALRRPRLPSTSSSLYQSFNASLQAPMITAATTANLGSNTRFTALSNMGSNTNSSYENQTTTLMSASSNSGGVGGIETGGTSSSSSAGNSNFVSIIFNVLDFLF